MAEKGNDEKWQEIRGIHRQYRFFYEMVGGIILVVVGVIVGFILFPDDPGYRGNLYTTILGVLITIFVLDRNAERREEQRAEKELKARLIRELGSSVNEVAKRAAEELAAKQWLNDKVLQKVNLVGANLQGVRLIDVDLQGAELVSVNFANADLRYPNLKYAGMDNANLQDASLKFARLQEADMDGANLCNANLEFADLYCTDLRYARLVGTNLMNANLKLAKLIGAEFNESTTLPDGCKWTPETDMRRFTAPEHPNFWRSADPRSPAYRGKKEDKDE